MTPRARLGLVVLILLLAWLFRMGPLAYAFYALLMLLAFSRWMGGRSLSSLSEVRVLSRLRVEMGTRISASLEVRNFGRRRVLWVLLEDLISESLPTTGHRVGVASLAPGAARVVKYEFTCPRRGYYQIGPVIYESGDLFGITRRFQLGDRVDYVTVLPKVVGIARYGIPTQRPIGEVAVGARIFEDPTRIAGVREYRNGDPLRRVHWRASARAGTLQSKLYDPSTMLGANLILDFQRAAYGESDADARAELAVTVCSSTIAYITAHHREAGLLSNGIDGADRIRWDMSALPSSVPSAVRSRHDARAAADRHQDVDRLRAVEVRPSRGALQIRVLMDALARIELHDGLALQELLLKEYRRFPRDIAQIVVTPRIDAPLGRVLASMKHSGFAVTVIIVRNERDYARSAALLAPEGIRSLHVRNESDLQELAVTLA